MQKKLLPWIVSLLLITMLVMGANVKEKTGEALLNTTTAVAMGTNNTKADLFTVPTGKTCIVTRVVIRGLSGAVACGTDNDFGAGATAAGWKDTVNLSTVDATDDFYCVTVDNVRVEAVFAAGDVFGIQTDISSDASTVTAVIDVFGYLY